MGFSEKLTNYVNQNWAQCPPPLGTRQKELEKALLLCSEEEALLLRFLYLTLPLSDLGDYAPGFFLQELRHSLWLRKNIPYCRELPEELFLLYVLCPRVNTEELRPCRKEFYSALQGRVKGLSPEACMLQVNLWCAQQASYRSTDDRTASPMAVLECGFGRCGEESAFAVAALRSVGIAARQVYAPLWSHCDDNHAWVEAYDGERWRFLGACEPEPVLDLGWFIHAASRAMLEHARAFVRQGDFRFLFPDTPRELLWRSQGVVYENVTQRYGNTRLLTVEVRTEEGAPASGALVSFQVLNMARFSPVALLTAGEDGRASIRLGLGSVLVCAHCEGKRGEALLDLKKQGECELVLHGGTFPEKQWESFSFFAPPDSVKSGVSLSAEQKREREKQLAKASSLRESRVRKAPSPQTEQEQRAFLCLSEKDRSASLLKGVLEDAAGAFQWEKEFPKEVFEKCLLSERIGLEPLFPWREKALSLLSATQREAFRQTPEFLWQWIQKQIHGERGAWRQLPASVRGILNRKAAPFEQLDTAFVAFCRALGIPARLSPKDSAAEYYGNGRFHRLKGEESASVRVKAPAETPASHGQNWSLSRRGEDGFQEVRLWDLPGNGEREETLLPGEYRLVTCVRKPDGDQLGKAFYFTLNPGEHLEILLSFSQLSVTDFLENYPFPPIGLTPLFETREQLSLSEALGDRPSLAIWLEPGREPAEHVLNELLEHEQAVKASKLALHLILAEETGDPTVEKVMKAFPEALFWKGDFSADRETLARRLYLDPEQLPLVLLTDKLSRVRYSCCGYSVGTVELLLRLASTQEFSAAENN